MSAELSFKQRVIIHLVVAALYSLGNFAHGFYELSQAPTQTTGQVNTEEPFRGEFPRRRGSHRVREQTDETSGSRELNRMIIFPTRLLCVEGL